MAEVYYPRVAAEGGLPHLRKVVEEEEVEDLHEPQSLLQVAGVEEVGHPEL